MSACLNYDALEVKESVQYELKFLNLVGKMRLKDFSRALRAECRGCIFGLFRILR
jgi:hypothetical protein